MTLSQQHRAELHRALSTIADAGATEALLNEFPATDLDRPASEALVRAEIAGLRGEMRAEIAGLRGEMRTEFAGLRGEMRTEFAKIRGETGAEFAKIETEFAKVETEFANVRGEMRAEFAKVETEFAKVRSEIADGFRGLTIWLTGAVAGGLTLAVTLTQFLR